MPHARANSIINERFLINCVGPGAKEESPHKEKH